MKLSIVIPARDEEGSIGSTLLSLSVALREARVAHELLVVDDGSSDRTAAVVSELICNTPEIRLIPNNGANGFGLAVRTGLREAAGDAITIVMADGSDSPADVVACYRKLTEGYDCVFGSRFRPGSEVIDYPLHKLMLNRLANRFIQALFGLKCNDVTNAFKCYRREVVEALHPLISSHFNLTVEMPLKAIVRGYSHVEIPIRWTNRRHGVSKLKIKEMGSRYLFIVLWLWLEKHLSRGDYHRRSGKTAGLWTSAPGTDLERAGPLTGPLH